MNQLEIDARARAVESKGLDPAGSTASSQLDEEYERVSQHEMMSGTTFMRSLSHSLSERRAKGV